MTAQPEVAERELFAGAATAADLASLAERSGWTLIADHPRGHVGTRQLAWATERGHRVVWAEAHDLGACWVTVLPPAGDADGGDADGDDGDADRELDRLVAVLRDGLDVVDRERVLDDLSTTDDPLTLLRGLPLLGLLPLPVDEPRCLRAFERALNHPLLTIRRAALQPLLLRAGNAPWPGLRALLADRLPRETELADRLRHILDLLDEPPVR